MALGPKQGDEELVELVSGSSDTADFKKEED